MMSPAWRKGKGEGSRSRGKGVGYLFFSRRGREEREKKGRRGTPTHLLLSPLPDFVEGIGRTGNFLRIFIPRYRWGGEKKKEGGEIVKTPSDQVRIAILFPIKEAKKKRGRKSMPSYLIRGWYRGGKRKKGKKKKVRRMTILRKFIPV